MDREELVMSGKINRWEKRRKERKGEERAKSGSLKDEGKYEEHGWGIRGETNWLIFVRNTVIH